MKKEIKGKFCKLYKFKQLSKKRYLMDLGNRQISIKLKEETPYYPKILKLQNRLNRLVQRDQVLVAKKYNKLYKKKKQLNL